MRGAGTKTLGFVDLTSSVDEDPRRYHRPQMVAASPKALLLSKCPTLLEFYMSNPVSRTHSSLLRTLHTYSPFLLRCRFRLRQT